MWLKRNLLAKLLLGLLLAVVLPFSLSNLITYQSTSRSVEAQFIELNQKTMDIAMSNVKRYFDELNRLSVSFYFDATLMGYLRSKESTPSEMLYITDQVANLYHNRTDFRAVQFISVFTGQTFTHFDNTQLGNAFPYVGAATPLLRETIDERSYEVIATEREHLLVMHKQIVDYPREDVLGFVSLYIGQKELEKLIKPLSDSSNGEAVFLYLHNDSKLLYTSMEAGKTSREGASVIPRSDGIHATTGSMNGQAGVYISVKDQYLNLPLTLVKFVPDTVINESANRTLQFSLWVQVTSLGIVALVASVLAVRAINPLKRLIRNMAQVESGNFHLARKVTGRMDEIGVLEMRFGHMVGKLDELINKEYRNRLELSTAKLKMLQAQINPHFLYNALQSIGTLALRHRVPEISEKIAALGAILRYSMDFKTEVVPLYKEIGHIEHYLSLQTGRFKNKLSYMLSCTDSSLDIPVPKMMLQPLVENSIVHGIENGNGSGTIHISIELKTELIIRVMDTGKGMDEETLSAIRLEYESRNVNGLEQGGIGLLNVLNRMQLYYGSGFHWEMNSTPYKATIIALYIPIEGNITEGKQV
ncbi:sensor histidine kinase [Paenibacillus sp. N3.4]|uniref:sensor histidine kinase n=1 Tax=Paenibacillus sp. N3.4 TaxID=2603222 RepID=UPI0011C77BC8|nr:histidine kinase [Paenibacillus sp. N3.4]TXK84919.1 HAMP domain-containing protein [Paenibacillus sp. N3.4]